VFCFFNLKHFFARKVIHVFNRLINQLQFHALNDLLIRLFGSLAVFALVRDRFIPSMRAQNDLRRPASAFVFGFGAGGFRLDPVVLL